MKIVRIDDVKSHIQCRIDIFKEFAEEPDTSFGEFDAGYRLGRRDAYANVAESLLRLLDHLDFMESIEKGGVK